MTAIFEVFEYKFDTVNIISQNHWRGENLFSKTHTIESNEEKASRVIRKIYQNLGKIGVSTLIKVYLSERKDAGNLILSVVKYSIQHPEKNILRDFSDKNIMEVHAICKIVNREARRMQSFVRFECLQDDFYCAKIEPNFNILPLIMNFFQQRYADQKWIIFDIKRGYALLYDLSTVNIVYPEKNHEGNFLPYENILHKQEKGFQLLWQRYFEKINIVERTNTTLHRQLMPERYWKYLTEKQHADKSFESNLS